MSLNIRKYRLKMAHCGIVTESAEPRKEEASSGQINAANNENSEYNLYK